MTYSDEQRKQAIKILREFYPMSEEQIIDLQCRLTEAEELLRKAMTMTIADVIAAEIDRLKRSDSKTHNPECPCYDNAEFNDQRCSHTCPSCTCDSKTAQPQEVTMTSEAERQLTEALRRVAQVEDSLTRVTMARDALRQKVGEAIKERPPMVSEYIHVDDFDAWADRIAAALKPAKEER